MAEERRAIDICTCHDERLAHRIDPQSGTSGPCLRQGCGCPGFIPHPQPRHGDDLLSADSEVISTAADALRKAEGRGGWGSENLPGRDVERVRLVLLAVDMLLASRRVR